MNTTDFIKSVKSVLVEDLLKANAPSTDAYRAAGALWMYSASCQALGNKEYLLAATRENDYFLGHFVDNKYGGIYASLNPDGSRCDTTKSLKVQAAAIIALCEYNKASGNSESLKTAVNVYNIVCKSFACEEGWSCALTRDFSAPAECDCKCKMILATAFAAIYNATGDEQAREKAATMLLKASACTEPGCPCQGARMLKAALAIKDFDTVNAVRERAKALLTSREEGAAAIMGQLLAWKYLGCAESAAKAVAAWEALDKAELSKNPVRSAKMCLEVINLF